MCVPSELQRYACPIHTQQTEPSADEISDRTGRRRFSPRQVNCPGVLALLSPRRFRLAILGAEAKAATAACRSASTVVGAFGVPQHTSELVDHMTEARSSLQSAGTIGRSRRAFKATFEGEAGAGFASPSLALI